MSKPPAARFRIGYVSATIWENASNNGKVYYSVELARTYREGEEYKQSGSLMAGDLLNAAKVLQMAEEYISAQS